MEALTLADYHIEPGYGIYTDMNAIRSDEELGNLHSLYVDQWDWERVITAEDRNADFLKEIVNRIYAAMIRTEYMVYEMYPQIKPCLPQKLHFIHSEELRQLYPNWNLNAANMPSVKIRSRIYHRHRLQTE